MSNPFEGAADMVGGEFFDDLPALPSMPTRTALIDADMILYAAAFAAQDKGFDVATGQAHRRVNQAMQTTGATSANLYLTGAGNFRAAIAVTAPYKGNRADREKPDWYDDLRWYMVDEMGAVICNGQEADDMMAISQHAANRRFPLVSIRDTPEAVAHTVICTGDKDLNVVAGWHYDTLNDHLWFADPVGVVRLVEKNSGKKLGGHGLMFFLAQLLTGDTTDNIPGAPAPTKELAAKYGFRMGKGFGPVSAAAVLAPINVGGVEALRIGYRRVLECYQGDNERLVEMARLLWMRHRPEEMWQPSDIGRVLYDLNLEGYSADALDDV